MGNPPVITNKAPIPGSVAKIHDAVRMGFRVEDIPIDRAELDVYLGYGAVRWEGGILPENSPDYEFQLDRMFGNPAPYPDTYATITVELDDSLKINKYLASDEQIAFYSFGRLEAPAAGDALIMEEITAKIDASDTSPDGNDFTGVLFGVFIGDSGFTVKFFYDGASTRWIEVHDADQNTLSALNPVYVAAFDWHDVEYTYKTVWDPVADVFLLIVSSGQDELSTDTVLVEGLVSDFVTIPSDQIRENQPIGFFGHGYPEPTSISYWRSAYLYHEVTKGVIGGIFQGRHEGAIRTDNIQLYLPEVVPDRSDPAWMLIPDTYDTIDGIARVVAQKLELWRDNPNASFGFYKVEPSVDTLPIIVDFALSGEVTYQESGLQTTGMEVYVDDGVKAARVALLWSLTERRIGILGGGPAQYLGSYFGFNVDWREEGQYRLVFDPGTSCKLYEIEQLSTGGLRYSLVTTIPYSSLPDSSMPGPGVGFLNNAKPGEAEAKMVIGFLRYMCYVRVWEGGALPASPWTLDGAGGTPEIDTDGTLVLNDTSIVDHLYYKRVETTDIFSYGRGFTVDFRCQVVSYEVGGVVDPLRANTGVGLAVDDGSDRVMLLFAEGGPELGKIVYLAVDEDLDDALFLIRAGRAEAVGTYAAVDWTEEHSYRLERTHGANLTLFIDEAHTASIEIPQHEFSYLPTEVASSFRFGSLLDDRKSESRWEFLHYTPSSGLDLRIDQIREDEDRFDKVVNIVATAGDLSREALIRSPLQFDTVAELYEDFEEEWPGV